MENMLQPQGKFVTANSLKLHYLDWGNPNAFEVAAHNFLSSSSA